MPRVKPLVGACATAVALAAVVGVTVTYATAHGDTAAAESSHTTTPKWRVSHTASYPNQSQYTAITAPGADDVWVAGNTGMFCCGIGLMAHWNGKKWTSATLPTPFVKPGNGYSAGFSSLASSSSSNVWAIGDSGNGTYTLRWNGHTWAIQHYWKYERLSKLTVFGTDDVWATSMFANKGGIWHYNGTSWSWIPSSVQITAVSALAADNMWGVGFRTVNGFQVPAVAHWNGHSWMSVTAPKLPPDPQTHQYPTLDDIAAISAGNVWVVGYTSSAAGDTPIAEHWDGHTWSAIIPGHIHYTLGFVIPDGQGGVWAGDANPVDVPGWTAVEHFTGGHWWPASLPAPAGRAVTVADMALVPHSTTVWAAGLVAGPFPKAGPAPQQGDVLVR